MWDAYNESTPKQLKAGEWHIPFADKIKDDGTILNEFKSQEDWNRDVMDLVKIATVMSARTSYTVVGEDQKPMTCKRMIELHDEMLTDDPKHMSPFEHCGRAMDREEYNGESYFDLGGNFKGFIQYRKLIHGENITS